MATGFNMKKKNFFKNINYSLLFGVFGTLTYFVTTSVLHGMLFHFVDVVKSSKFSNEWIVYKLTLKENLLLSALICSSDIIAAISLVSSEEHPKLASIIFGEGILNDAVAIILYKTVNVYTSAEEHFTVMTPVTVFFNFLKMG